MLSLLCLFVIEMNSKLTECSMFSHFKLKDCFADQFLMSYFHDVGGSGGKGTWGGLLDIDDNYFIDPNDPNYDSSEVHS